MKKIFSVFLILTSLVFISFAENEISLSNKKIKGNIPFKVVKKENVKVPIVVVDATVVNKKGDIVTGLKKGNFKLLEDGKLQKLNSVLLDRSPLNVILMCEATPIFYFIKDDLFEAGERLIEQLEDKDYCAIVSYSNKVRLDQDFTRNKKKLKTALRGIYFNQSYTCSISKALKWVIDRAKGLKGRTVIIIIGTGWNSLNNPPFSKVLNEIKGINIPIFTISIGREWRRNVEYFWGLNTYIKFKSSDFRMLRIAKFSGGMNFYPEYESEFMDIMYNVLNYARYRYVLTYYPKNRNFHGEFRKLKIEAFYVDKKGKKIDLKVYHRDGYVAYKY